MCALIIQASDRDKMFIKRPAFDEGFEPVDEKAVLYVFEELFALIKRENPRVVIFNLACTVASTHKIELHYALRGRYEISPMGVIKYQYASLAQLKEYMLPHFTGLKHPL